MSNYTKIDVFTVRTTTVVRGYPTRCVDKEGIIRVHSVSYKVALEDVIFLEAYDQ